MWRHPGQLPADSLRNKCHEDVVSVFFSISGCRECFSISLLHFYWQLLFLTHYIIPTPGSISPTKLLGQRASKPYGQKSRWFIIVFIRKMSKICNSTLFRTRPLVKMLHMNLSARTHPIASQGKRWWFPSKCCNLDFYSADRIWVIRKMDSNNLT